MNEDKKESTENSETQPGDSSAKEKEGPTQVSTKDSGEDSGCCGSCS